jgi:hypothetical protein
MPEFSGSFDGAGHTVYNVNICVPAYEYEGLFGKVTGSIKNVGLSSNISNASTAGALAGYLYLGASVENSYSNGSISGKNDIGGLIGYAQSYNSGNTVSIRNCYSMAAATDTSSSTNDGCGGLVGEIYGYSWNSTVKIEYSYATGKVTKPTNNGLGGLIGYSHTSSGATTVLGSYVDNYDDNTADKGTYKSTSEMKQESTYSDWDFDTIWSISSSVNNGYPYLQNLVPADTVAVTGISLNKNEISLSVGTAETLTAVILPSDATNKNVTWSSSNTSVAVVTQTGKVTAKAAGTATITATTSDGGYTASCTVTVTDSSGTVTTPSPSPSASPSTSPTPTVEPTNYPYEITSVSLETESGLKLTAVPVNSAFIVNVEFSKNQTRNDKDYLFVAVYDTNGALLSLDYARANFTEQNSYEIGFHVPAQSKAIGSVKAFVWNTFNSAEPLAQAKTITNY